MEITKERLGPDSKKITTFLVVFFIVLPVFLIVFMMHQNPLLDLSQGFSRASVLWASNSTQKATVSSGGKHNSSHPLNISDDIPPNGVLVPKDVLGSGSRNDSLQSTSMANDSERSSTQPSRVPDAGQFNGPLASALGNESSSEKNTTSPDSMLDGASASGINKGSVLRNKSFHPLSVGNDKLLNGLLAPGFDEKSCLSRYQSFLYRKSLPHKPSTYLLSKLRKYEKLHKRCGPLTKSFKEALKSLQFDHINSTVECKYIVWLASNGMGNRMLSIASTFLYAFLTNRVLLVEHGTDMAGLFCEPFPDTSWLLPVGFPLKKQFNSLKANYAHNHKSMLEGITTGTSNKSPPSFLFLSAPHVNSSVNHLFPCGHSQALLRKVPWLILSSDQYFAPVFFLIPSLQQEMSKLFPERDTMFYHLGQYLFHPSNKVWGLITSFYEAHFRNTEERIGLQIRVFNARRTPFPLVMDKLLSCILKDKLLPEVDTRKSVLAESRDHVSKAVLITSLSSWFYENLSNMYSSYPTVTGEAIGVYQPSHEEYQHRGDNIHNMKALAEIYLLSLSDVLVTSAASTFGYVAQGLGGLKPWLLRRPAQNKITDPPCVRDISMDPCFHYPPSYLCEAETKVDAGAVVPYIKRCVDRNKGVKLVNSRRKL